MLNKANSLISSKLFHVLIDKSLREKRALDTILKEILGSTYSTYLEILLMRERRGLKAFVTVLFFPVNSDIRLQLNAANVNWLASAWKVFLDLDTRDT